MIETTNRWQQFLASQGMQPGGAGFEAGIAGAGHLMPLSELGLIAVSGADAASFLHSQLTNDIERLPQGEVRLAGYCSPKGRLLATMLIWRQGDGLMLELPRQIQPAIQKRLQMYVLRAKARLADANDEHVILGLSGPSAAAALAGRFPGAQALPPYGAIVSEAGALLRLADADGQPRYQWIADPEAAIAAWPDLAACLRPASEAAWRRLDIHAGIPQITLATQEQFVPQMINYELVGGVNFKKGCYPGQEIVARSQYLGSQKRRMLPATLHESQVQAGMEVFSSADPGQPCGRIVNAEAGASGAWDCLVEVKTAALAAGSVHLARADGAELRFGTLPYALPDRA